MFRKLVLAASSLALATALVAVGSTAISWKTADALTNCSTNGQALDGSEQQLLSLINAFRTANGVPALKASPNLSRAAAWMSEDQSSHGTFSHTDSLGRSPFTRVQNCGYATSGAGENLAYTSSAQSAFNLWQNSTMGHRENMLNSRWTVAGIGHQGAIWTADFGSLDDSSQPWDQGGGGSNPTATNTPTPSPTTGGGNATPTNSPTSPSNTPPGNGSPTASPTPTTGAGGATPIPGYKLPSSFPIRRAMIPLVSTE